jgi:hypothetical protein
VHYAHAIIDIIVDESIKAKIIYLLDAIPDEEKLRNLNRFFPVEIPDYVKLLEDILNRDYNMLSIWTKASVLRNLPSISNSEMSESVVALLFSPENLLQEEAVKLIARSDIKLYKSVYCRIPVAIRKNLDKIIDKETDKKEFLYEKILFLSGRFEGIIEEELLMLAKRLCYFNDVKTFSSSLPDGYILWDLTAAADSPGTTFFYTSEMGEVVDKISGSGHLSIYVLPFRALNEFLYQFPDNSDIIMTYFEKY